jgi:hypothetical protein
MRSLLSLLSDAPAFVLAHPVISTVTAAVVAFLLLQLSGRERKG